MQNLEEERDIGFVNTLSTIVTVLSVILIIILTLFLFFFYLLSFAHSNVTTPYLIIPLIVFLLVLISSCISIRGFNKYGFVVLKSFFGILILLYFCTSIYLLVYSIMGESLDSLYLVISLILLVSISLAFYYIFKRLNQIYKS